MGAYIIANFKDLHKNNIINKHERDGNNFSQMMVTVIKNIIVCMQGCQTSQKNSINIYLSLHNGQYAFNLLMNEFYDLPRS